MKREFEEYFMFIQDIYIFYIIYYYDLMAQYVEYEALLKNLLRTPLANAMYTSAFFLSSLRYNQFCRICSVFCRKNKQPNKIY